MTRYIGYTRVSTASQGQSGLGAAAQLEAIHARLGSDDQIIEVYTETLSGRRGDRPKLIAALAHARRTGAALIISKVDRLTRSARFLHELLDSGVELVFCDMPEISGPQGRFVLSTLASVAELECGLVSQRTRAALQAARARGVRLGGPKGRDNLETHRKAAVEASVASRKAKATERAEVWRPVFKELVAMGLSFRAMARELDARGERKARGGRWDAKAVSNMVRRLDLVPAAVVP